MADKVEITIQAIDQATSTLNKIKGELGGLDDAGKKTSSRSGGLGQFAEKFFYIGNAANMVIGTIQNVAGTINKFTVSAAADMESTSAAFETLIGNTELARDTIKQIQDLGASTPFQFPELADAGRKLLAFGTSAQDVRDTLARVGDIASGIQQPIGEIAEIYGKAKVQGRLFAEDINQLTGRGIPIIQELAKQFGVADDQVKQLVTDGKVTFDNLEQAFIDMTSEGGKFNGMMEKQSQTFNGLVSTLQDNVTVVLTRIGAKIIETFDLKGALEGGIAFINNNMPLIESVIDTAFTAIMNVVSTATGFINEHREQFEILGDGLVRIWTMAIKPTLEAFAPLFKAAFDTAGIAINLLLDVFNGAVEVIVNILEGDLGEAAQAFFQIGVDLVQGLINGVKSMFTGLKNSVVNLGNNVVGWFKETLGIESPSKVMLEQGKFVLEGLILGLQDSALRAELQAEIDAIGQQIFTLQLAAGNLSPTTRAPGTTQPIPPSGNGSGGVYTPGLTGSTNTFNPVLMGPLLPAIELMSGVLTDTAYELETFKAGLVGTYLDFDGLRTSAGALTDLISQPVTNAYQANIDNLNMLKEGAGSLTDLITGPVESGLIQMSTIVPDAAAKVASSFELIPPAVQEFSSFIDFVNQQLGPLGGALVDLATQIPFLGKAFLDGVTEIKDQAGRTVGFIFDPIMSLASLFIQLFAESKTFATIIRTVNALMAPFIGILDALNPLFVGLGLVMGTLYNALSGLIRVVSFGAINIGTVDLGQILGIPKDFGVDWNTQPEAPKFEPPKVPTAPKIGDTQNTFDLGRLPTSVQMAVYTPLVQTLGELTIVVRQLVNEGIKVNVNGSSGGMGPKNHSPTVRYRTA